jgi:hypothetical protein
MSFRRYARAALLFLALNAAWEVLQLPFYTLWRDGTAAEIAYALAHCTAGDLLIGIAAACAAAVIASASPVFRPARPTVFLAAFLMLGVVYTVYSEWLNVHVRESWSYSDLMPLLPPFGTGLTPLLQWVAVPLMTWWIVLRPASRSAPR